MKKIIKVLILLMLTFFSMNVYAIQDFNGGTTSNGSGIGDGAWNSYFVGLKVSIISSENVLEETKIFYNSRGMEGKLSSQVLKPKTKQSTTIAWVPSSNVSNYTIENEDLPSKWIDSNEDLINIYNLLSAKNYKLLLDMLNNFTLKSPGDYILVEPMAYIGGYYGTAFELGNAFMNSKYNNAFSTNYKKWLFSGTNSLSTGGLFYTTIYLKSNVSGVGLNKFSYTASDLTNAEKYDERNDCLRDSTCGRGIGVFKYDDIYSGKIIVQKKDSKDKKTPISGAGFTLYSDSSCSKKIKNEIKSNSKGEVNFTNLATGTYYFKETTVPNGYKADTNTCHKASVENTKTITMTIHNTRVNQNGDLNIFIKNKETKALITSSNGKYHIYSGSNCSGDPIYKNQTTSQGKKNIKNLKPGTYSIKEVSQPDGYEPSTNKCVKSSVKIEANKTTDVTIEYVPSCTSKLNASNKSVDSLLTLYNEYKFNGLLNFGNPSCKNVCQDKKDNDEDGKIITGCLSGKREYTFSEWNLSCFDDAYQDPTGMYVAFCQDKFDLKNLLGVNKFYSKSGEFFIQKVNKDDKNYMQIYNEAYNPVLKEGNYLARATSDRVCYIYNTTTTPSLSNNTDPVEVYFGDNDSNEHADKLNTEVSNAQTYNGWVGNGFYKTQNTTTYNFKLPTLYLKKLTGKVSDIKVSSSTKVEGVISTFNSTEEGTVLYKLKLGNNEYNSDACKFKSEKEIITYEGGDDPGNLELEFRSIDAKNPFNGRETNANWCDKDDCSSDNNLVVTYIKNRVDSYGNNGTAKPKYKITLYPQDIQVIRSYNTDNMYDEYIEYCDQDDVCRNAFVHDLKNGTLYQYKNNVIKKTYGNLTNKLILGSN